jgi:D-glycero-alpha-D-manno-heptose-7-phosphate kinase
MIVARSPLRITLGGGGTDLPSYYSKYGGFLIAGAVNKYILISANKHFFNTYKLKYSEKEETTDINEIKHNLFREALRLVGIPPKIELTSMADIPDKSGLGSSGAFLVCLLTALHAFKKETVSKRQLAEEACKIEIEILKEPVGKQDQYISAYGGITAFEFQKDGTVKVDPIRFSEDIYRELEQNIMLFYTGISRSASAILKKQDTKTKQDDQKVLDSLHTIKDIGLRTKKAFQQGDIDKFGEYLHEHWNMKKSLSDKISNPFIDKCYDLALKNGAMGGKIMGAGGGGFLMFYHNGTSNDKRKLIKELAELNVLLMDFRFDNEGAKILLSY